MYNGIGLHTVRGSATSGHVTKNMSYLKPEFFRNKLQNNSGSFGRLRQTGRGSKANTSVIQHNAQHALEAEVYELRESLSEKGYSAEEIEKRVEELKQKQHNSVSRVKDRYSSMTTDSHAIHMRKDEEIVRLRDAFGLDVNGKVRNTRNNDDDSHYRQKDAKVDYRRVNDRNVRRRSNSCDRSASSHERDGSRKRARNSNSDYEDKYRDRNSQRKDDYRTSIGQSSGTKFSDQHRIHDERPNSNLIRAEVVLDRIERVADTSEVIVDNKTSHPSNSTRNEKSRSPSSKSVSSRSRSSSSGSSSSSNSNSSSSGSD